MVSEIDVVDVEDVEVDVATVDVVVGVDTQTPSL